MPDAGISWRRRLTANVYLMAFVFVFSFSFFLFVLFFVLQVNLSG